MIQDKVIEVLRGPGKTPQRKNRVVVDLAQGTVQVNGRLVGSGLDRDAAKRVAAAAMDSLRARGKTVEVTMY